MDLSDILHRPVYRNSVLQYLGALALFVGVLWGFFLIRKLLIQRLRAFAKQTETDLDDLAVDLLEQIRAPEAYVFAAYVAMHALVMPARVEELLRMLVVLVLVYRGVNLISAAVGFGVRKAVLRAGDDASRRATASTITVAAQLAIWVGAAIFLLSNFGFNVSSMLAGLGIGGIAVALAAQAVLGDLFAALSIFLDKPFEVGDAISIGDSTGTVEHIGLKTTRIRSVSGELLVMGNSQLTSARIRNFKRMHERRVVLAFGLVYDTPVEKLSAVPGIVRGLIEQDALLRFERAHFMNLGQSSLDYEAVYWVKDADYNKYMDSHQRLLLAIMKEFESRGLEFAFPTRTVHVHGGGKLAAA